MEENLRTSLLTVCGLLEVHKVQYVLVGGTAVALNGYFRHSVNLAGLLSEKPDIDIWYDPTYTNYFSVLKVIHELGHDVENLLKEKTPNPKKSFFRLEFDNFTVDILPQVKAPIKFSDIRKRIETEVIEGVPIHFMSYADLIFDKEALGRKKDLDDIEQLRKIKGE